MDVNWEELYIHRQNIHLSLEKNCHQTSTMCLASRKENRAAYRHS